MIDVRAVSLDQEDVCEMPTGSGGWHADLSGPKWLRRSGQRGQAPVEQPTPTADVLRRRFPPHKLTLHNDDHNTMDFVVESLVECIPGTTKARATAVMFEAHEKGQAIVYVGLLEEVEHFWELLSARGLTVTQSEA